MNVSALQTRSESKCELCSSVEGLDVFAVSPHEDDNPDTCVYICKTCTEQVQDPDTMDMHHWRCLNESMWSQTPAVQVVAWRMLTRLRNEGWARDLLDMLYLDDDVLAWAKSDQPNVNDENEATVTKHLDSNGTELAGGDTVVLIKDLNVKGANFTAKRGTTVRGISLVQDNAKHIEGRVNGQQIVILTEFVKKS